MTKLQNIIGIDISKSYFDIAWQTDKGYKTKRFSYDASHIAAFAEWLTTLQKPQCIMESTGTYHLRLAHALHASGIEVSVVNPLSAKRFIQSTLSRSKTDKTDACRLVEYGMAMNPPLWEPTSPYYTQLQQLLGLQELYIKERTSARNQLEAVSLSPNHSLAVIVSLNDTLRYLSEKLQQLDVEMQKLVDENDHGDIDNISSIPGIGKKDRYRTCGCNKGNERVPFVQAACIVHRNSANNHTIRLKCERLAKNKQDGDEPHSQTVIHLFLDSNEMQ